MSHFIVIDSDTYLVDTDAQVAEAKAALRDAGIASACVWSGEPDEGEAVKTWMIVFAT